MEVCEELVKLAKEFNKHKATLYIVGGYVRDGLMGFSNQDIDIASALDEESVLKICNKLKIKTNNINKHLGTLQLIWNKHKFEYTRFRKESYSKLGTHTPDNVEFVDSLEVDSRRRDFTINSIYYNILEDQLIDPTNGISDIECKVLRTAQEPKETLKDDGLRILRAVRFASTFDFNIDRKTLTALIQFAPLLKAISKERVLKEIVQLVSSDLKHNKPNQNFLQLCNRLSLPQYIFNSRLSRIRKFSKQDIKSYYQLPEQSRRIGFYILVIKNYLQKYTNDNQLCYSINMLLGLDGIKESNEHITTTEKIYRVYQNLQYGQDIINASINYLTLATAERKIIDAFLDNKAKSRLSDTILYIKEQKLPLSIHELDICAQDLIDLNIERKYISKILSTLYNQVLNMSVPNINEDLKNIALEMHKLFIEITKEKL